MKHLLEFAGLVFLLVLTACGDPSVQPQPGGTDEVSANLVANRPVAPKIQILDNPAYAQVGTELKLNALFRVTHPTTTPLQLTITSDVEGLIYSTSDWRTEIAWQASVYYTFNTLGRRTITVQSSYGSRRSQASFALDVVPYTPQISLWPDTGAVYPTLPHTFAVWVTDGSEPDPRLLCDSVTWEGSDNLSFSTTTGCEVTVTFPNLGYFWFRVTARNSQGAIGVTQFTVRPSVPIEVKGFGVFSRLISKNSWLVCQNVQVSPNSGINLSHLGCTSTIRQSPLYFASVEVSNPYNFPLSYEWTLQVGGLTIARGAQPFFDLYAPQRPGLSYHAFEPCTLTGSVGIPSLNYASRYSSGFLCSGWW